MSSPQDAGPDEGEDREGQQARQLKAAGDGDIGAPAERDPHDPEPTIAGRALVGLTEISMQSRVRHTQAGLRGQELHEAVMRDVRRAARLLDTGLWPFNLPASRRARTQAAEAARAAEDARRQVVTALREARAAWDEARTAAREAGEEIRRAGQGAIRADQKARRKAQSERQAQRRRDRGRP